MNFSSAEMKLRAGEPGSARSQPLVHVPEIKSDHEPAVGSFYRPVLFPHLTAQAQINYLDSQLGQIQGAERSLFGRFQDDSASGCQSRTPLPGHHQHRIVPWDDLSAHSHRLLACHHEDLSICFNISFFVKLMKND